MHDFDRSLIRLNTINTVGCQPYLISLFLAASLVPLLLDEPWFAGLLLLPAGLVMTTLSWQKSAMPLHFDVGDKSQYQI